MEQDKRLSTKWRQRVLRWLPLLLLALGLGAPAAWGAAAPTVSFTSSPAGITDKLTSLPFAGVNIADADGDNVTVRITFPAGRGTFPTGADLTSPSAGTYDLSSRSAAAAQTFLRALVYTPVENRIPVATPEVTTFTVAATDPGTTTGQATVDLTVSGVNDAPTLTTVSTLPGATEDTAFPITFATLTGAANEADVDLDALSFRVEAVSTGTLTKGGVAVVAGTTLLGTGESLVWTPAANANGTLNAFTVKVSDGTVASSTAVQVQVTVAPVNDLPTITGTIVAAIGDNVSTQLFSTLVIADVDEGNPTNQLQTVIAQIGSGGEVLTGSFPGGVASVTNSGTPAAMTTALAALNFNPVPNRVAVGGTESIAIAVIVTDSEGASVTNSVTLVITSINDPPVLTSGITPSTIFDTQSVQPFTLGINDPDVSETFTATLEFVTAAHSAFAVFEPANTTFTGSAAFIATQVQAVRLRAVPNAVSGNQAVPIRFRVSDHPGSEVSSTHTMTIQPVNDLPDITGVPVDLIRIRSDETASPFSTITILDVDAGGLEIVHFTVQASASGVGRFFYNGGYSNSVTIAISNNTPAAATAALRSIQFEPTVASLAIGQTTNITFTITVTDPTGGQRSNNGTVLAITRVNSTPRWTGVPAVQPALFLPGTLVTPFAHTNATSTNNLTLIDDDASVIVTITLDNPLKGGFANMAGTGFVTNSPGVFSLTDSPASLTTKLRGLVFELSPTFLFPPTAPGGVTFNLSAEDPILQRASTNLSISVQGEPRNFLVTRTEDDFLPGSLRHALTNASNDGVITFALPSYPALLRLQASNGPVVLTRNVSIKGPGADLLTLSGDSDGNGTPDLQLFRVEANVLMAGLTLTKGSGTGGSAFGTGGAISVGPTGNLTLRFCAVTDSQARFWGGGIDVDRGSLMLENSLIRGNSTDNGAGLGGGGVSLYTDLPCVFLNSTFSGNQQRSASGFGGGGLYVENFTPATDLVVQVTHCTFAGNTDTANQGSSIHANVFGTQVRVKNSIFADAAGRNLQVGGAGRIISQGGNLSDDAATTILIQGGVPQSIVFLDQAGDLVSATVLLGPLSPLRGPTEVHPLLAGSPAISRAVSPDSAIDQRGVIRDASPDSGAFEFAAVSRIVINEIQAKDTPADFIEFYLLRDSTPLNLTGYSVWVDGVKRHVFPVTPIVRPGFGVVVADSGAVTTPDPSTPVQIRSETALGLIEQGVVELRTPGGLTVLRVAYLDRFVLPSAPTVVTPFPGSSVTLGPQFFGCAYLPHVLASPLPRSGARFTGGALDPTGGPSSPGADTGGTPFGLPNAFPFATADAFVVSEDSVVTLPVLFNDLDADGLDRLVVLGVGAVAAPVPSLISVASLRGALVSVDPANSPVRGTGVQYDPRAPFAIQSLPAGAKLTDTFFYSMVDIGTGPITAYEGTLTVSPTVVVSPSHRLVNGDKVVISGSGFAGYNAEHTITRIDDDKFSIPVANGGDPVAKGSWVTSDHRHPTATNAALATLTIIGANDPPVATNDLVFTDESTILRILGDTNLAGTAAIFETDPFFPLPRTNSAVALLFNDDDVDTDDDFSSIKIVGVLSRTNGITGYAGTSGVSPVVVQSAGHGLVNGAVILIANYGGHPSYNGYHTITVIDPNSFSIPVPFVDDHARKGLWAILNDANRLAASSLRGAAVVLEIRADRTRTCVVYNPRTSSYLDGLSLTESDDDRFFYAVEDRHGALGIATVTVRVSGLNDAPRPQADPDSLLLLTPVLGGSTLSNFVAQLGVLYALPPASGESNRADVQVIATNGVGQFFLTNLWVTAEDVPLFIPATNLLANDTDIDRTNVLRLSAVSTPSRLGASVTTNSPIVRYDPGASAVLHALARGEKRIDTFEVTITDDQGGSTTSLVAVLVVGKNDSPVAVDDLVTTTNNLVLTFNPITHTNTPPGVPPRDFDPDVDGTAPDNRLALIPTTNVTTLVAGVRVTITESNAVYDPTGARFFDALGLGQTYDDKFNYTVMDGSFVFAVDDFFRTVADGSAMTLEVLANDRNLTGSGGPLRITSVGTPNRGGAVAISATGATVTYTPEVNFVGDEFFTYSVTDANGNTDSALVNVRVTVNQLNGNLQARADEFTVAVGESPFLDVLANDNIFPAAGSSLTITRIAAPPALDSVALAGNRITFTQHPTNVAPYFVTFVYEVSGGGTARALATAIVRVVDRRGSLATRDDSFSVLADSSSNPLDVLANDHLLPGAVDPLTVRQVLVAPTNGTVTIEAGSARLLYTPTTNFIGLDFLTYLAADGLGGTGTGVVQIAIGGLTTANDFFAVPALTTRVLDVLANDRVLMGTAGSNLTIQSVSPLSAPIGTISVTATNTLAFVSGAGAGESLFTYVITDGAGRFATGRVSVIVVLEGVKANADFFTVAVGSAGNLLDVLSNDVAIPEAGRPRTIVSIGTGVDAPNRGGTVAINATSDGLVYTPDPRFSGEETFTYRMTDSLRTDTARVVVRVSAGTLNANNDAFTVFLPTPSGSFVLPVLANDRVLPDLGQLLTITVSSFAPGSVATPPSTLAISPDGLSLIFTPGTNLTFPYTETINYEITDGTARRAAAVAVVEVRLRTDSRDLETNFDSFAVEKNSVANVLRLLVNDDTKPATANGWTITQVGTATFGGVISIQGQSVLYTPRTNFVGTDVFTYSVSDGFGGTGSATVFVKVGDLQLNPDRFVALSGRISSDFDLLANDGIRPELGTAYHLIGAGGPDRGGKVSFIHGRIYYTSDPTYAGVFPYTENFFYAVTNDSGEFLFGEVAVAVHEAGSDRDEAEVTVRVVGINDPPTITGAVAGQRVYQRGTIRPFANVTITDVDFYGTQPLAITMSVNQPLQGFLIPSGGFVDAGGGLYTLGVLPAGVTPAAATAAVRGLVFVPTTASRVTETAPETTRFTITANDGALSARNDDTSVIATHQFRSKLVAADGLAADLFGTAVAVSRDVVVVGVPSGTHGGVRSGVAYIYERDTATFASWRQVKKLGPTGTPGIDNFGQAVAIHGDTVIVGAPSDHEGSFASGSVYMFGRNVGGANNWGLVRKVLPSDPSHGQSFGSGLSLDGDTLAVASRLDDDLGHESGSVYILERNLGGADVWGPRIKLRAFDGVAGDKFGIGLGLSGDTLAVGADFDDDLGVNSGSAYVFERNLGGANAWGFVKKLLASDGAPHDQFGRVLAISGDVIVVGSPLDDDLGFNSGSAYVFGRNHGGAGFWGQASKLTAADGVLDDQFGSSVAIQGTTILVGAPRHDARGHDAGAAYHFEAAAGALPPWIQTNKFLPDLTSAIGEFGLPVALDRGTVAVGARFDADRGHSSGSVTILRLRDNNPPQLTRVIPTQAGAKNGPFSLVLPADAFTDPDVWDTLTLSATGPAWLSFVAGTRTFSGTPPAAGTSTVTVTATDSEGLTASTTFNIVVIDPTIVPIPGPIPTLQTITTDPDYLLLTFLSFSLDPGTRCVLEVSSDLLVWTPADPLLAAKVVTPVSATTDTVTYYLPRGGVIGLNLFFRVRIDP